MPKSESSKKSFESAVQTIVSRYPEGKHKSALLPVLHLAQEQNGGWLSVDTMNEVAAALNLQPIEVYEVATFYTMFYTKPVGKHVLEVCRTGPCALLGADKTIECLKKKLKIDIDETTADGQFTLKTVECLACCGTGPIVQVGDDYHENVTEENVDRFLGKLT